MIEVGARPPIRYAVAVGVHAANAADLDAGGARVVDDRGELDMKLRIGDGVGEHKRERFELTGAERKQIEVCQHLLAFDEHVEDAAVGDVGACLGENAILLIEQCTRDWPR